MARKAPILGSISCNGRCMIWTSADRNAKHTTIAIRSVIAIFTIVHRRSSRCSRNGFDVSLSGNSRNLKRLRKAIRIENLLATEGEKPARHQTRAKAKGICVTDFVGVDHAAQFMGAERLAIENRFGIVADMALRTRPNRGRTQKISTFVGKPWRSKIVSKRD